MSSLIQRLEEKEIESEQETEEPSVGITKHSSQYYTWSSTGTETEDEGDDKDDDWGPAGETKDDEGTTEDEEEVSEDQSYIK